MISANSLAAEAIGMADQMGSIMPGLQADIIALDGNPRKDITAVRRVAFVMKGGIVYKNAGRGAIPLLLEASPNPTVGEGLRWNCTGRPVGADTARLGQRDR